ncbi:retinoic acid-induced protein 2 isoform X2 [Ahaetulla prasina]|uniref:retinoic acid-induced protein 2 isoform X2 n=1 Tax=Ahaetulla prasina TaxID=499056 RepID=UPI0026496330|nr:retinoic acid-induced protein 2 isoform X2 [Ahaetulla prasina]
MKPLGEVISGFGVSYHLYADDTQLYFSTPNHPNKAVEVLSRCLEAVRVWMGRNRLKLNPSKTEWLWMPAPRYSQLQPQLTVGGELLAPMERVRNLGVLLDGRLSFDDHLVAVSKRAFHQVRLVRQLRPFLDREALCTVTHALVTSRLDYCNALYMGLPLKCTRRLQLVQNAAARVIVGATRCSHVTPLLRSLHWLPVVFRVRFKILVTTFKALHGLGPGYLRDRLLLTYASHRPVRSHREGLLRVPSAKQCRLAAPRGRAFSVGAPTLWNELPPGLRQVPDLRTFRRELKTHLFIQAGLA